MSYGIIEYNAEGLPKCEICGKHFARVLTHVRQKHFMTAREYKIMYGFDLKKGILSEATKAKSQESVKLNYDLVVTHNLINQGNKSRYENGHKGRTKDLVSEQTRIALKKRLESGEMKEAMRKSGQKVGLSGLGNKVRWNKD